MSFLNATLVLSIGETVEEVTDSGFLGTMPTLCCAQIGENALIQIYPDGIRHIRGDKRVNEWRAPGKLVGAYRAGLHTTGVPGPGIRFAEWAKTSAG